MPVELNLTTRNITTWPEQNINYWGITKSGNTTMKIHLWQLTNHREYGRARLNIHDGRDIRELSVQQANSNNLRNIAIVRHPFTRFLSMWKDMCKARPRRGEQAGINPAWTPLELITFIKKSNPKDLDVHFVHQYRFIEDAKDIVIAKLEEINSNWPFGFKAPVKQENKTDIVIPDKLITQQLMDEVYEAYKEDYERFGYDKNPFPEKKLSTLFVEPEELILQRDKVLIVGSGRSATKIKDWSLDGWSLVTINHAYQIRDDWEIAIYAGDFLASKRPKVNKEKGQWIASSRDGPQLDSEVITKEDKRSYDNACKIYGKKATTMFFNASYWVLHFMQPKVIGYIGCDMNYTPSSNGDTHFYGIGEDIQRRKIPDPDKMIKTMYKNTPNAMETLMKELEMDAEKQNAQLVNFSEEESRLPFPKKDWKKYNL